MKMLVLMHYLLPILNKYLLRNTCCPYYCKLPLVSLQIMTYSIAATSALLCCVCMQMRGRLSQSKLAFTISSANTSAVLCCFCRQMRGDMRQSKLTSLQMCTQLNDYPCFPNTLRQMRGSLRQSGPWSSCSRDSILQLQL